MALETQSASPSIDTNRFKSFVNYFYDFKLDPDKAKFEDPFSARIEFSQDISLKGINLGNCKIILDEEEGLCCVKFSQSGINYKVTIDDRGVSLHQSPNSSEMGLLTKELLLDLDLVPKVLLYGAHENPEDREGPLVGMPREDLQMTPDEFDTFCVKLEEVLLPALNSLKKDLDEVVEGTSEEVSGALES